MSLEEIAQNITPVGSVAAVIGVVLGIAVIMIRVRARNLVLEKEKAERMQELATEVNRSENADEMHVPEPQHKSTFKTFVPE